jgi:hypothetical protein
MAWGWVLIRAAAVVPLVVACGGSAVDTRADDGVPPASKTGQACPGAQDVEGGGVRCRSSNECSGNETCQLNLPYPCSNGVSSCYQDADCGAGRLCIASGLYSCVGFGALDICSAPCSETSCAEGSRCEADGRCGPTPCHEGYDCPSDLVCADDADASRDEHGCRVASCQSDDYTCPAGFECQPTEPAADKNGCMPVSCVAGFECPANQRCVPDSQALYTHQCERLPCERDSDCDCGYCLEGRCRDALSFCAMPPIG